MRSSAKARAMQHLSACVVFWRRFSPVQDLSNRAGSRALIVPLLVLEGVGGAGGGATLALVRLLGAATLGLGIAALMARNHLDAAGGLAAAYGLGLYNVLAAPALIYGAASAGGAGLWGAGLFHAAVGALLVLALLRHK